MLTIMTRTRSRDTTTQILTGMALDVQGRSQLKLTIISVQLELPTMRALEVNVFNFSSECILLNVRSTSLAS